LTTEPPAYNRRYVAYAKEHGRTVAEQLAHDAVAWPGGKMIGFILWNNERIAEYAKINPDAFFRPILTPWDRHGGRPKIMDHESYDAWLQSRADPENAPNIEIVTNFFGPALDS
jgi:hypothetical protein